MKKKLKDKMMNEIATIKKEHKGEKSISRTDIEKMSIGVRHSLALELINNHLESKVQCPECHSTELMPLDILTFGSIYPYCAYYRCEKCNHIFEYGSTYALKEIETLLNILKLTNGMFNVVLRLGTLDTRGEIIAQIISPSSDHAYIWDKFGQLGIVPSIPYVLEIELIESNEKSV